MKAAQTSSREAYFEGGPWDGQTQVVEEFLPVLEVVMPQANIYASATGPYDGPGTYEAKKECYYRERAPHRSGCVTYFSDEPARDRAYVEDAYEVVP